MHTINNETDFWGQFYESKRESFVHFQRLRKYCTVFKKKLLSFQVKIKQLSEKVKDM
jgi:hypothetical protein